MVIRTYFWISFRVSIRQVFSSHKRERKICEAVNYEFSAIERELLNSIALRKAIAICYLIQRKDLGPAKSEYLFPCVISICNEVLNSEKCIFLSFFCERGREYPFNMIHSFNG